MKSPGFAGGNLRTDGFGGRFTFFLGIFFFGGIAPLPLKLGTFYSFEVRLLSYGLTLASPGHPLLSEQTRVEPCLDETRTIYFC
jgi:hypothetical protein